MNTLQKTGERIDPDFIEEDFISAIETNLNRSIYYRDKEIQISRISQTDENELGYDGVLTTIVPFYIQFKRSFFYTPHFSGKLTKDRNTLSLQTSKGFYAFELLKRDNKYAQHNAMHQLSKVANAAYVAPLFYKSTILKEIKNNHLNKLSTYFEDITIMDVLLRRNFRFNNLRMFKNAISLRPHKIIVDQDASHHYSFTKDLDIAFHSEPINVENSNSTTLYKFVIQIIEQSKIQNLESFINGLFKLLPNCFTLEFDSKDMIDILNNSLKRVAINGEDLNIIDIDHKLTIIEKLLIIEDILWQYFNIRQFVKFEKEI